MRIRPNLRDAAAKRSERAPLFYRAVPIILALALTTACASSGSVRSGVSAVYSTGLSVTLVSWRDAADLGPDKPAEGRWLTASVRVDYDGNAQFAEVPAAALKILWEAPDGSKGHSAPLWIYDPTPGVGWSSGGKTLRVRMSNRFTLAFDIPAEAAPHSFEVGEVSYPLNPPMTP